MSREAIVARALEIGNAQGLDAVSLRRIASEFGVTPMALYRHVKDKQDLINAMTEKVLEGMDLTVGFLPSMSWTDRVRKALTNYRDQVGARPLALHLSIAYSGDGPPAFWKMTEDLLGIALEAGFEKREAIVMIRVISNLVTGYLLLFSQNGARLPEHISEHDMELVRKRVELAQLSLPPDRFPNIVANARAMTDVWLSDPNQWWSDTVDLIVFGLESIAKRQRRAPALPIAIR